MNSEMRIEKKILSLVLVLAMVITMVPMFGVEAWAEQVYVCVLSENSTSYASITAAIEAAGTTSSTIRMIADSTENVTIAEGKNITIDLNGYVLKAANKNSVITNNGTLTIKDSNGDDKTYWFTEDDNGVYSVRNDFATPGAIRVSGGCITGGNAYTGYGGAGGGIYNNGTLFLQGGNVIGNMADSGGGVYVSSGASFTMTGGNILGNAAFTGGGAANDESGIFIMTGGFISDNTGVYFGGGVMNAGTQGSITLGGTAKIKDNTALSSATCTYVAQNLVITTVGAITVDEPADGMDIYVTFMDTTSYNSTTGVISENGEEDDVQYFHSDSDIYEVKCVDSHLKLEIKDAYKWYCSNPSATEFTISNIDELEGLAYIVNSGKDTFSGKTVKLANDYKNTKSDGETSAELTTIIGYGDIGGSTFFVGTFDGNGKNVKLNISEKLCTGGETDSIYVAGMFGILRGTVKNVSTSGNVTVNVSEEGCGTMAGGVAGSVTGSCKNCSSSVTITAISLLSDNADVIVGGVVGTASTSLENCSFTGFVQVNSIGQIEGGGIVGSGKTISNCYSTGNISVSGSAIGNMVGGIAGQVTSGISSCYSAGNISVNGNETYYKGAVVGLYVSGAAISNCYYRNDISDYGAGGYVDPYTIDVYLASSNPAIICAGTYALPESQMKAAAGTTAGIDWVSLGSCGTVAMSDALNEYVQDKGVNVYRFWGVMNDGVNGGYPVFAPATMIFLKEGKAYNGENCQAENEIAMPEGISYEDSTYVFNKVNLPAVGFYGILSIMDNNATIELNGNNQIGVKANTAGENLYCALCGLTAYENLTITGDGSLTIYSDNYGILGINITFDDEFTGTLNSYDIGSDMGLCCIFSEETGGSVTIESGTFYLNNTSTYAIKADIINLSGGTINAKGGIAAICATTTNGLKINDALVVTGAGAYAETIGTNEKPEFNKDTLTASTIAIQNQTGVGAAEYVTIKATASTFDDRFGGKYSLDGTEEGYTSYGALTVENEYTVHDNVSYTFAGWYTGIDGTGTELSDAPVGGTTYYAKWTNNGKTVVTQTLNFTDRELQSKYTIETNGIKWDSATSTLTLNNATIDVYGNEKAENSANTQAIVLLPDAAKLVIPDGTSSIVNLESTMANNYAFAIEGKGTLAVSGTGILNVSASANNDTVRVYGISTAGKLTIADVTLNVFGRDKAIYKGDLNTENIEISGGTINARCNTTDGAVTVEDNGKYAIHAEKGDIVISNGAVNAKGGAIGIIASNGKIAVSGGAITVDSGTHGLHAKSSIDISGGMVNAKAYGYTDENTGKSAKAIYSQGTISISGAANVTATCINDKNITASGAKFYGIRAKDNITITGDNAIVSASGSTAAFNFDDGKTFTATNAVIKAGADEASAEVQTGDAKTAVTSAKYANIKFVLLTVSFDAQNGSSVTTESAYQYGTVVKPADPIKADYTFDGWYTDAACTTAWNFANDKVTDTMTLYAKWIKNGETGTVISGGGASTTTYTVTSLSSSNGKVTASVSTSASGKTITLTVTPDNGWTLETITVLDNNGKEVSITPVVYGEKYTFTMPSSNVTVKATFMEDNSMLNYFVDVTASDYFYDAVLWAAESGITDGVDATHFNPSGITTRAQMVTFLWRAAGCPEPTVTSCKFIDVASDTYFYKAVLWAVEQGITTGTSDTTFSPYDNVSRAQTVTFLWRYKGSEVQSGDNPFTDVPEWKYYYNAILWAKAKGVTDGTSANKFSPNDPCTRGQIVTFIYRSIK